MQIAFFSNGGFVAHKYHVPESVCRFSVWFNRDGFAVDAQRIDSMNRAYPVTAKQWQHIERHKIAGLENATAMGGKSNVAEKGIAMNLDVVTEKLNTLGESVYEYETSHVDAGSNYAHMPCESWTEYDDSRLAEYMQEKGIDFNGLEIDEISDRVMDQFEMQASHAFGMGDGSFLVASYPVGEIETEISAEDLGITAFTKELCESLSQSSGVFLRYDSPERAFGYVDGSYDVWDCVISEKALREIVDEMRAES